MPKTNIHHLPNGMWEATRLTRAGRLTEATALIQRTLRGGREPSSPVASTDPVKVASTAGPMPATSRFIASSLTNRAGTRTYKVYIPSGSTSLALPLIVMLHGCTQDVDDFAAGTRMNALAEERGFLVVYPQQSSQANPSRCWNWFKPSDQQRGRGEPSIIADITREVAASHNVDPQRIYVAGMSAGAVMAMTMAVTHPELYAAVGVHSGLGHGVASDLPSAFKAMKHGPEQSASASQPSVRRRAGAAQRRPAVIVFHGDADRTVNQRNAEWVLRESLSGQLGSARPVLRVHKGQQPGGLAYTRYVYSDRGGAVLAEGWSVHGLGHAWSGGAAAGSYTDPSGPDASTQMIRFFTEHPLH